MDRLQYSNVLAGVQMVPDHTVVALVDATYQMLRAALGHGRRSSLTFAH